MMTVKEYANDTGHSIAEILKKCNELGIKVKSGDDDLSEDDINCAICFSKSSLFFSKASLYLPSAIAPCIKS